MSIHLQQDTESSCGCRSLCQKACRKRKGRKIVRGCREGVGCREDEREEKEKRKRMKEGVELNGNVRRDDKGGKYVKGVEMVAKRNITSGKQSREQRV